MKSMTPRERLLRALNHEEPDRVPLDLGGTSTSIETIPYNNLKNYLGKNWETRNFLRDHVELPEEMLQMFDIDTRYIRIQPRTILRHTSNQITHILMNGERNGRNLNQVIIGIRLITH